ncbi:hypothetical protein B0H14DRAFT_233434 [Mycena olivaceomarginata]|nr:hypothetical protein B0H14DRAFT_233434 [Mycena olivaceomarginata]
MVMMTLKDVGFWTRWIFDLRAKTSGQDLSVASDMLNWDTLVATFARRASPRCICASRPRSGGRISSMPRRPDGEHGGARGGSTGEGELHAVVGAVQR